MPEAKDRNAPGARAEAGPTRDRRADARAADIAGIDALVDRLVPALTAKLASTHLGELEIRDGPWRLRLRRPAGAGAWNGELRRATDRASRSQPGHEGHGHPRAALEAHRVPTPGGSNGSGLGAVAGQAVGPGRVATSGGAAVRAGAPSSAARPTHEDDTRRVATSPAVGVFRPGGRAAVGSRVRGDDVLGHVDVLGVAEEVKAPADGVVTELLVEGGTAVEYGQELIVVALAAQVEATRG